MIRMIEHYGTTISNFGGKVERQTDLQTTAPGQPLHLTHLPLPALPSTETKIEETKRSRAAFEKQLASEQRAHETAKRDLDKQQSTLSQHVAERQRLEAEVARVKKANEALGKVGSRYPREMDWEGEVQGPSPSHAMTGSTKDVQLQI